MQINRQEAKYAKKARNVEGEQRRLFFIGCFQTLTGISCFWPAQFK